MTDVIVVGGGAVGQMIAYRLQVSGSAVVLIDSPGTLGMASTAAGAMLGAFGEVVSTTFATPQGRARFHLDLQATKRWPVVMDEIADRTGLPLDRHIMARQTLVIQNTIGSSFVDDSNFKAIVAALTEYGGSYSEVDVLETLPLRPHQVARPLRALAIEGETAINPNTWLADLGTAFLQAGGNVAEARVKRVLVDGGKAVGIEDFDGQRWRADNVVLASGVFTQPILEATDDIGTLMPLFAGAGVSTVVSDVPALIPDTVIRTPNRAFACGLHAVPRKANSWYLGATNHIVPTPVREPLVEDAVFLLNCAIEQLHCDIAKGRISSMITGNRPVSADAFPLIGRLDLAGLFIATGTYREGIHLSPVIADYVCDLVMGKQPDEGWEWFDPRRKPRSGKKSDVIEQTVQHALATGDEFSWRVPPALRDSLEVSYTKHFHNILDRLDCDVVPPPEILTVLDREPTLFAQLRRYYRKVAQN
jgi:glycine oxidase